MRQAVITECCRQLHIAQGKTYYHCGQRHETPPPGQSAPSTLLSPTLAKNEGEPAATAAGQYVTLEIRV